MTEFKVLATSRFEREMNKLAAAHPDLLSQYAKILAALRNDPYNRSHRYSIRKLEAVAEGQGQYRIRSGRFRFRYDIDGQTVYLKACSLRREDTYR